MKLFFDTNVILDILLKREPHYAASARIFSLVLSGRYEAYASVLTFSNIYYVLVKSLGHDRAVKNMQKIASFVEMLGVTPDAAKRAFTSGLPDYEDAVQYLCAKEHKMDCIVTRNKADFAKATLEILTPEEVLARGDAPHA